LPLRTVVSCRGNPLWLPLRYWLIDKYPKIYASVLNIAPLGLARGGALGFINIAPLGFARGNAPKILVSQKVQFSPILSLIIWDILEKGENEIRD